MGQFFKTLMTNLLFSCTNTMVLKILFACFVRLGGLAERVCIWIKGITRVPIEKEKKEGRKKSIKSKYGNQSGR